jgi:hypothetical protein
MHTTYIGELSFDTYMGIGKMFGKVMLNAPVLCYKCGQNGYLCCGWVDSIYRLKPFRGEYKYCGLGAFDPKAHKVIYDRYGFFYIRHYSPEKYREQMKRYRSHQLKSRPNGQKRCYIPTDIKFHWDEENKRGSACMSKYHYYRSVRDGRILKSEKDRLPKIFRSQPLDFSPASLFV